MPKYRSAFEERVAALLGDEWEYEPQAFVYTSNVQGGECINCASKSVRKNRKYTPDFVKKTSAGTLGDTWIEVKGYFKPGTTTKYKDVRKYYPNKTLRFVFSNPNKPIRKGSKTTMAQWAEKNGWQWTTEKLLKG